MKTINDIIDMITTTCKEQCIHLFCGGIQECIYCSVVCECPHRLYINSIDAIERGCY